MRGLAVVAGSRDPPDADVAIHMLKNSEQRLLEMVRRVGYGSLGNIPVRDGELVLGAKLHTRCRHRLGKPDGAGKPHPSGGDFKLKRQHLELVVRIRAITVGTITVEIQDGLPINLIVDEVVGI